MSNTNESEAKNNSSLSEAEKFLESLNLDSQQNEHSDNPAAPTDPKDIMSFLDEISNYQTEEKKPASETAQTSQENTTASNEKQPAAATGPASSSNTATAAQSNAPATGSGSNWMSWGNSLWSQASAAVKTTTEQINRSVNSEATTKMLEDRMKNLQSLVNKENIEKLGNELRNLTQTIMETVAPPISEHEVVEVWLSHDMVGYSGLEALVYRSFARIMEYTETGQVIVRGTSEKSTANEAPNVQELNMCEGLVEGTKLTKANIDHLVKTYYTPPKSGTTFTPQSGAVPVINCPVFMAIQPVKYAMPSWGNDSGEDDEETHQLVYLILLYDPTHQLKFKTLSQTMPLSWLDVPYEENEWIEDKMVETLQMAVRTIAQDYVWTRMTGGHQAMQATANEVNKSSETQEASLKTEKEP